MRLCGSSGSSLRWRRISRYRTCFGGSSLSPRRQVICIPGVLRRGRRMICPLIYLIMRNRAACSLICRHMRHIFACRTADRLTVFIGSGFGVAVPSLRRSPRSGLRGSVNCAGIICVLRRQRQVICPGRSFVSRLMRPGGRRRASDLPEYFVRNIVMTFIIPVHKTPSFV